MKERIWTPEQLERKREGMRRLREERKAWGLCSNCGAKRDVSNHLQCSKCLCSKTLSRIKKEEAETPEHRAERLRKMRVQKAKLREYRAKNHLCLSCGKPAYKGLTRCYECNIKANRWMREKRKRENITRIPMPKKPVKLFIPSAPSPNHPWRLANQKLFRKGKLL